MQSQFKIGDKVKFIKSNDFGTIKSIISERKIEVQDSSNFLSIVNDNDIIKFDKSTDNIQAYGDLISSKDLEIKKNKKNLEHANLVVMKVDLHTENIDDTYSFLTNYEIVQKQIIKCERVLISCLNSKTQKLIIVHGIGQGVLKNEVHRLLNRFNLRFFESINGGSTEVML